MRVFYLNKMEKEFKVKESYLHEHAKNLLANKLREIEKEKDFCSFNCLSWRSNYGIFTELPFHSTDDIYYFECSDGLKDSNFEDTGNYLDRFDTNFQRGKILFVPDIVVFHKGTPKYIIEIVHTHSVPDWKVNKIEKFFNGDIELYEVSAYEIMTQVGSIDNVTFIRLL